MSSDSDIEKRIERLEERVERAEERMGVSERSETLASDDSLEQRHRLKSIKQIIELVEKNRHEADKYPEAASIERVLEVAELVGIERSNAEHELEKLRRQGEVYEPATDYLRVT